jgi:RHS repeat-associated protein
VRFEVCRSGRAWTYYACLLTGLAVGGAFGAPAAHAAVGATPGSFQVSQTGAATYSIPIWVPPGPRGMQPNIALTYNSSAGIGPLGIGWSISGLSSIYRCQRTYAQDGAAAPVTLTVSDAFCIDGKRLQLVSGIYGEAGSTYQTEIADFSNVTAYGTAGSGPAYFVVQTADGHTYTYGSGGNSQVIASGTSPGTALSWQLSQESDRAGNTVMNIGYSTTNATGVVVPSTISWSPTVYQSSSFNYTMYLNYGANVAQSSTSGYEAGTPISDSNLLASITVSSSGTTVRNYVLSYELSPTTSREELTQVQECANAGATNCLAPTTITYQSGAIGVSTSSSSLNMGSTQALIANYDLNGDGYRDVVFQNSAGTWYVAFGSASGYGTPVSTGVTTPLLLSYGQGYLLIGDLLGKGSAGFMASNGGTWWYYTWNGSGFSGASTGVAVDTAASSFALADTDGDGLPDLVSLELNPGGVEEAVVYIRRNTGNYSGVSFGAPSMAYTNTSSTDPLTGGLLRNADWNQAGPLSRLDFNGDGRDDLSLELTYRDAVDKVTLHSKYELLAAGATFQAVSYSSAASNPVFLDWNDDGCTDYLEGNTLFISACNGSAAVTTNLGYTPLLAMDWDGDGRKDLIYQSGGVLYVQLSDGQGLAAAFSTGISYNSAAAYFAYDVNGDGLDDLVTWTGSTLSYNPHNGGGVLPDLLSKVTDGYGNWASPSYGALPLAANTAFFPRTDAVEGYSNYIGPQYIVESVTFNDPSTASGTYLQQHTYTSAWMNRQGRGFAGFESHQFGDSRNNVYHTDSYQLAFPYTGMQTAGISTQNGNASLPISSDVRTLTNTVINSTAGSASVFPWVQNDTLTNYDVSGPANGQPNRTQSTNYNYDIYGNATSVQTTVTDNTSPPPQNFWETSTTNTMDVDKTHWCLRLISNSVVTYSAASDAAVPSRTLQYTPDTVNCRNSGIVTEWGNANYSVSESFLFDNFGNINSDTVTGENMAPRVTLVNWGTTGQFPMSMTDPSGATTTYNYNFGNGLITGQTNPNNESTTWGYDGFGRESLETRPDLTSTVLSYNDCSSSDGCPLSAHALTLVQTIKNYDGTTQSSGTTYYDSLERLLVSNVPLLSGSSRRENRYDSLGNIKASYAPCTWAGISSVCPYAATTTFDVLNRPTEVQRPVSETNSMSVPTFFTYQGRSTTITDANGHSRVVVKDVNGRLRVATDSLGYSVTTGYDAAGNRMSVSDSLGNTLWSGSYVYGLQAFLTSSTDPDRGGYTYSVDALGERTGWSDSNHQSFAESYDALSRPLTRAEPDLFTQWIWGNSPASHNVGRLVSACTGTGGSCNANGYAESETYDSDGRPSQRSITMPSTGTYNYAMTYDGNTGLISALTYPTSTSGSALQLQYVYQNGIQSSVVANVPDTPPVTVTVTVWQANSTDAAGRITQETLGNGVVTNRAFDAVTGTLASVQSGVGGGAGVQNLGFLYDYVGNVTQRQNNNLGLNENFEFDNDDRLSTSTLNGQENLSIAYDPKGNIASRSDVAGGGTWTYDPVHIHAVTQAGSSSFAYAYDANGNATQRQGNSIQWSSYNYPTAISAGAGATAETAFLSYGPGRQKYQQIYTGNGITETTQYIGNLLELVTACGTADYRHYIYANGRAVAVYSRKGSGTNTFSYLLTDHQGSVETIANSSGAALVGESFTAYGSRRSATSWSGAPTSGELTTAAGITRQGYTFQTQLGLWMGLNHMNGRVQDSITGRFLSADPHIPDPSNPQDYNRYTYVRNNPLSYVDPSGFYAECVGIYAPGEGEVIENPDGSFEVDIPSGGFYSQICFDSPDGDPSTPGAPPVYTPPSHTAPPSPSRGPQQRPPVGPGAPPPRTNQPQGGHDYQTQNPICQRALTPQEQSDLISRFTVPNVYTQGQPKTPGTYMVANGWGIPGGWVNTTFTQDGLAGTNATTPFHVFTGVVTRGIVNSSGGAYMVTHGTGGYSSLPQSPSPYESSETGFSVDIGGLLDAINDLTGPPVFNAVDQAAAAYAQANFPGC